jgi:nucleoside-diphosphate-sugar epimerase
MREPVVLVTGAAGEIGHALIESLSGQRTVRIVSLDLKPLPAEIEALTTRTFTGTILDRNVLDRILAEFEVDEIYHLAALLSTRSEFTPVTAHQVNVDGTLALLEFAQSQGMSHGRRVKFLYPSSIAAYGLPGADAKASAGKVSEDEWAWPVTMYGCNKLYCEHLGRYYMDFYKQLDAEPQSGRLDFRGLRFPGLISAVTVPSGGTSDYVPEMLHAAAQKRPYACFVRPDARIPFMAMPDAVEAMVRLMEAERTSLSRPVYNITAFNPSAEEARARVLEAFPEAEIGFEVDEKRQRIVDSWPADVNDDAARNDWGYSPRYDLETAFAEYLIPTIRNRYR